jgi:hypothetical protein
VIELGVSFFVEHRAKAEQELRLHAAHDIGDFLVSNAQRSKGFERQSYPRVRLPRCRLGILDIDVDPAGVILFYDQAPRLSQKNKPSKLIYAFPNLRTRPALGVSRTELSKYRRQFLLV